MIRWLGNGQIIRISSGRNAPESQFAEAAQDPALKNDMRMWLDQRTEYLKDPGWFAQTYPAAHLRGVAYFSMEFGLCEALPIYSGGLGILAGDSLKAANDLGAPVRRRKILAAS